MITRVTTQMTMAAAQSRLQAGAAKVADLTDQATSLKAIRKPSDDPTGTATAMQVRKEQAQAAQHARNADDAVGWLATTDSALAGVSKVLGKVRDLTVQAASDGTMGTTDRQAFISELQGLKADLLSSANTKYGTRSVFAGSSPAAAAYAPDTTWAGSPSASVTRTVGTGDEVRVDTDGSAVFGTGDASVFALLDDIVADLQAGTNVNPRLNEIDAAQAAVRGAQADVGVRHSAALSAQDALKTLSTTLEGRRSGVEDKALAQAVLDLQVQSTNYQAALAVTAKVLQPTLMDYLR
ncbi:MULTISPECIES: flagellar hook-associated protein FlgL [unclassified Curtobacterium]|uniref:flagellar hook-associated protein FlgL n=1 Tax=unclassified Curtobacterium TaxID=257496 RepID=UPI000D9B23A2|nr:MULTISPECIES: flagellar hook-associated protein FlgL [unclassified Curtobacterium]PYY43325.1 flagellar hook-associated protein 3 [Curtobacterium sp. MCPF17_046]PYY50915.1 flagellar hook-associated protein 3 [Curtobacterium sp. MCBD17_023]PZE92776.1 flagellar hook-associated protein 3 [Curtobacterium sp. MCBD17_008]